MNYLLSVIIPTKNRYNTLLPLLEYLLTIDSNSIEILVQDNSDDNKKMLKFLSHNKVTRLSYYHSEEALSQTGNSDRAVLNSKGEYICFIGDDDGVMPYIVDVVKWMKKKAIESIKGYKPFYVWPGLPTSILDPKMTTGNLKYREFGYSVKKHSTKKGLEYLLNKGGTNIDFLPCLYHGITSRRALDKIYAKAGSFFPGPSPDMANATALCIYLDEYTYVDFPVVVSGRSLSSIAGQGVLHKHISKIEDVTHLPKNTAEYWEERIPRYWTGETIWAESAIKALRANGFEDKIDTFNFTYMYAKIHVFHFKLRTKIFENFPFKVYKTSFYFSFASQFYVRFYRLFKARILKKGTIVQQNVKDIGQAITVLNDKVEKTKLPF
ncbi:glycosyltransferase [Flagellimonas sp. S3867]|uniref:glycosyltransferase n=1 Tax=Flagellimonas sp. S3867 TaxID=2768063 RepID=UPI00168673FC|nr:glycosyltransferase [Flagellimonas sp. S3867]